MSTSGYTFVLGNWRNDAAAIRTVREQVLIAEMGLTREQLDVADENGAFHVVAYDSGGRSIGAARMQRDGRIDYVVVLRPWRGRTVGGALLAYLHHVAYARGIKHIWAVVPESAHRFFGKNRFVASAETGSNTEKREQKYTRAVSKPGRQPPPVH